jgi:hypothetical protein
MSVFRSIMSRIFGGSGGAQAATPAPAADRPAPTPPPGEAGRAGGQMATGTPQPSPATPPPMPAAEPVDVEAVLTGLAARNPQKLDWRHSIVDLMKLLDLDSSLAARKELAEELGYTGPRDGSAEMNLWLHRAVMRRLAENGGRVPDDLRD